MVKYEKSNSIKLKSRLNGRYQIIKSWCADDSTSKKIRDIMLVRVYCYLHEKVEHMGRQYINWSVFEVSTIEAY